MNNNLWPILIFIFCHVGHQNVISKLDNVLPSHNNKLGHQYTKKKY